LSFFPLRVERSKCRKTGYLEKLYIGRHLSIREIASLTELSHSMVLAAMDRFDIPLNRNGSNRPGQIPFGFDYAEYKLVKSKAKQGCSCTTC